MTSSGNNTTYGHVYDLGDEGNYVYVRTVNMELYKECANCFCLFERRNNKFVIRRENGDVSRYYKCPFCGCRIKAWTETVCNFDS